VVTTELRPADVVVSAYKGSVSDSGKVGGDFVP